MPSKKQGPSSPLDEMSPHHDPPCMLVAAGWGAPGEGDQEEESLAECSLGEFSHNRSLRGADKVGPGGGTDWTSEQTPQRPLHASPEGLELEELCVHRGVCVLRYKCSHECVLVPHTCCLWRAEVNVGCLLQLFPI